MPSISRLRANNPVFLKQPAIANIDNQQHQGEANSTQEGLTKTIQVNFDKETLQRMIDFMLRGKYDRPGLDVVAAPSPGCENESEQGKHDPLK